MAPASCRHLPQLRPLGALGAARLIYDVGQEHQHVVEGRQTANEKILTVVGHKRGGEVGGEGVRV